MVKLMIVLTMLAGIILASCASKVTGNAVAGGTLKVQFETTQGIIVAEIYKDKAPITAGNFLKLVESDFYDGLTFHRYVPNFVIQGGDPSGDGTGGSPETIPLEIAPGLKHTPGILSMARTADPNSASSQFFIMVGTAPHLDGSYAIFGKVVEGLDVAYKLREGDSMKEVKILH